MKQNYIYHKNLLYLDKYIFKLNSIVDLYIFYKNFYSKNN